MRAQLGGDGWLAQHCRVARAGVEQRVVPDARSGAEGARAER